MQRSAALALTIAAVSVASEARACSVLPLNNYFLTPPAAFEAEVETVRRVRPREWERSLGPIYEAEFRLVGPVRARSVPIYRWARNDDCGPNYPVKRGQKVWLLMESNPQGARHRYSELVLAAAKEDPALSGYADPDDFQPDMAVYPYTDDLGRVQEVLQLYRPF